MRHAALNVDKQLAAGARLAICGGLALYLVGHTAFAARLLGAVRYEKLVAAAALVVIYGIGEGWDAWVLVASAAAVIALLCAWEAIADGPRRVVAESAGGT